MEHKFHTLLNSSDYLVVRKLILLKKCLQVKSHNHINKINLIIVFYLLIFLYFINNLFEELLIRVNYLMPRFVRPWFIQINLLESYLSLLKCKLLFSSYSLLFNRLLLLYLSLLFFCGYYLACLAPFVADFCFKIGCPAVICSTSYNNLSSFRDLLDSALTFIFCACLLDGIENFDAVVTDSMFYC